MIVVKKVTKTYVSKSKNTVTALKNVSFTLPDKGLVFITGNSGSGKSTLLNILGGLDNITQGDILADGASFASFKPVDFDKYRNSYLGFVFQDFCLIEDLTVRQNLELVLDLCGKVDKSTIDSLLDKVHILNCADRFPKELSGGQKQRVAIARALAKDPKLILADEPTGNLDSKTTKSILKLLKDLSKTKLVVVVSHSLEDAETYGDRIIELSDGVIVRDEEKMSGFDNTLERIGDRLVLPRKIEYTKEDLSQMSEWVKAGKVSSVDQKKCEFYPTDNSKIESSITYTPHKSKFTLSKTLGLSWKFLKERRLGFIVTTIIVSCLFALLGVCQFFTSFDYVNAINTAMLESGENIVIGNKVRFEDDINVDATKILEITDEDIDTIDDTGYTDYYKLYNYNMLVSNTLKSLRKQYPIYSGQNLVNFYMLESYGTLVCSESHLKNIFASDNNLNYIGNLQDKLHGVIITDYMADSLMYYNPTLYSSHSDLLGDIFDKDNNHIAYINAVIDTNYEALFADFKEDIMLEFATKTSQGKQSSLIKTDEFIKFSDAVSKMYGIAYSLNANFEETLLTNSTANFTVVDGSYVVDSTNKEHYLSNAIAYADNDNAISNLNLSDSEMLMSIKTFNKLFGTNYTSANLNSFTPITITFDKCVVNTIQVDKSVLHTKEYTIVGLVDYESNMGNDVIIVDSSIYNNFKDFEYFNFSLYFTNMSNMGLLYGIDEKTSILLYSNTYQEIESVKNLVDVFTKFFGAITLCLCFISALLLVNFSVSTIRRRKFEIGVIKAMGGSTLDVGKVFVLQVMFIGIVVCIISTVLQVFASVIANDIIVDAMMLVSNISAVKNIAIISFKPIIALIDMLVLLVVVVISAMVPLIKLHRIKPVNIIKHKN